MSTRSSTSHLPLFPSSIQTVMDDIDKEATDGGWKENLNHNRRRKVTENDGPEPPHYDFLFHSPLPPPAPPPPVFGGAGGACSAPAAAAAATTQWTNRLLASRRADPSSPPWLLARRTHCCCSQYQYDDTSSYDDNVNDGYYFHHHHEEGAAPAPPVSSSDDSEEWDLPQKDEKQSLSPPILPMLPTPQALDYHAPHGCIFHRGASVIFASSSVSQLQVRLIRPRVPVVGCQMTPISDPASHEHQQQQNLQYYCSHEQQDQKQEWRERKSQTCKFYMLPLDGKE